MTSQIRSHAKYLIQTYYILVLIYTQTDLTKISAKAGFHPEWMTVRWPIFYSKHARTHCWSTSGKYTELSVTEFEGYTCFYKCSSR